MPTPPLPSHATSTQFALFALRELLNHFAPDRSSFTALMLLCHLPQQVSALYLTQACSLDGRDKFTIPSDLIRFLDVDVWCDAAIDENHWGLDGFALRV